MNTHNLPDHLYLLQDGQWALWRQVVLRGAGFPLDMVLPLALPECLPLAEQVLQAEDEMKEARKAVWAFLQRSRPILDKKQYAALSKMMRTVKDTELYKVEPIVSCEELVRLGTISRRLALLQADFQRIFADSSRRISDYIQTIAQTERFREAVIWQNRHALHGSIASLLQAPSETAAAHLAKQRKQEALVASYLQRYCTKNDTIGFFGPVGWAQITEAEESISLLPGPDLLATRRVYFEGWGIDALAKSLASDPSLRPWLIPRLLPYIRVAQTTLFIPFAEPLRLSESEALVLQACDGQRTAREIAHNLLRHSRPDLGCEEDVYAMLEQFCNARRIVWNWEISLEEINPEQSLRSLIERVDDVSLRQGCLEKLGRLEQAREAITRASGHADRLDLAFAHLEATFTDLTSLAPQRADGQMYAARTLVYEDCRRDLQVLLGPQVIRDLEKPLLLLLQSARWLTYYIAALYRKAFMQIYTRLVHKIGSNSVPFSEFWLWVHSLLVGEEDQIVKPLSQAFQRRWATILKLSSEQRHLEYSSEELCASVQSNFPAPQPGWNSARYHSPDILLAAKSVEAIRAGDFQFVLGEMHIALNTLQAAVFREQHPEPETLLHYIQSDLPAPRVLPVPSHDFLPITRTRPSLTLPKDYYLMFAADACAPAKGQALPVSSLFVEQVGNGLLVRAYDQQLELDIVEVFAEFLSEIASHLFTLASAENHLSRVSIDRLVVLRETWTFHPQTLQFAYGADSQERFISARHWVRENHLPRFCFVKTPVERKPCFVDFESSIYIDSLAKLIRRTAETKDPQALITLSEMLPSPEQTWLSDQHGTRYTNELRIAALDMNV